MSQNQYRLCIKTDEENKPLRPFEYFIDEYYLLLNGKKHNRLYIEPFIKFHNNLYTLIDYVNPIQIIEVNIRSIKKYNKNTKHIFLGEKYILLSNNKDPTLALHYKTLLDFEKYNYDPIEYFEDFADVMNVVTKNSTDKKWLQNFERRNNEQLNKELKRNKEHLEYLGVNPNEDYDNAIWNHLSIVDWYIHSDKTIPLTIDNFNSYFQIYHAPICTCNPYKQMSLLWPSSNDGLFELEWSCIYCKNILQINPRIKEEVDSFRHGKIIDIFDKIESDKEMASLKKENPDWMAFDEPQAYVDYLMEKGREDEVRPWLEKQGLSEDDIDDLPF
jgi:hypothetical protein